jgi:hypothetical protein
MEVIEIPAMISALLLMFASIGTKVGTAQLIGRMKHQISHVASIKQEALGRLKIAQSQKGVAAQNKSLLTTKKVKLEKRLNRMNKDMVDIKQEDDARKQRNEIRKIE